MTNCLKSFEERGISTESLGNSSRNEGSNIGFSAASSRWGSEGNINGRGSEFSIREVDSLRRMMKENEKYERRNNIVIKRIDLEKKDRIDRVWVEKFIDKAMGETMNVIRCRVNGNVIIATLGSGEMKEIVMRGKSRLKGESVFIEKDLTWKERKTQKKIYKWVKEERAEGRNIKIRYARVKIEGIWRDRREIERDIEKK